MFSRPLSPCFSLKKRLFCENQPIFACRLPIKIFYFEDFRWSFFGKIKGQKQQMSLLRMISLLSRETEVMLRQECTSYILDTFVLVVIQLLVAVCTHQR